MVVGSGAGGGPVAARLAEAGLDVLVLEAGPRLGAGQFSADESEAMRQLGTTRATANAGMTLYAGSCVGGSTVINDALCWRPPPEILGDWRDRHGLTDIDEELDPFVDRVWRDIHASPTTRDHLSRNAHRLELGAERLGWRGGAMARNVRRCQNLGRCNFGCPTNAKQSTLVTYLPRAERAGARVLAHARVQRIEVGSGAVRGVEADVRDAATGAVSRISIAAPVVCLAAGVLGTPALLLRSGLAGAGVGLQLHSTVHVTARFREPVHGYFGPTMGYAVSEFSDVNGRSGPGFMLEHTAVHPIITASALPGFGEAHAKVMEVLPHLARTVVLLRDRARGRVELARDGSARFDYALTADDYELLRKGIAAAARVYLAADALEVHLPLNGYPPVRSERDLEALADAPLDATRTSFLYAVHLFGGAVMSGSRSAGFCDPEGAAWSVPGLYVVDAAGLPGNTGVNPQVTIMANALRIAERVAESMGNA